MEFDLFMNVLYVISGVTGMTGNELVRQLLNQDEDEVRIIGFDNFFNNPDNVLLGFLSEILPAVIHAYRLIIYRRDKPCRLLLDGRHLLYAHQLVSGLF